MASRKWKLGEPCFIVNMSVGNSHASMEVMPAIVTQISGIEGDTAVATSYSTKQVGNIFVKGQPFASEKEARELLLAYAQRVLAAAQNAQKSGMHPGWDLPKDIPNNGDVVYILDAESKEILEVAIGFVQLNGKRLIVGYDESPGNPEASHIRINQSWRTRDDAEAHVRQTYGEAWAFVSKEAVAARTNSRIKKIWADAEERMKTPEFMAQMEQNAEALKRL